jgi:hypothetical protein
VTLIRHYGDFELAAPRQHRIQGVVEVSMSELAPRITIKGTAR